MEELNDFIEDWWTRLGNCSPPSCKGEGQGVGAGWGVVGAGCDPVWNVMSSIASTTTLQVSTLAALMHWQPRTLREVFRQLTGLRLKDVLLLWRIRQAKELIASGSASVDEAARCYGWRSRHGLDVSCRRYGQESASRLHARVVNAPVQAVREQLAETIRKKKLRK